MNELLTHEQYVCAHLDDRTAARALVDHHQEALDLPRRTALRAVARIRHAQRNTKEMAEAARLLVSDNQRARDMKVALLWHAGLVVNHNWQILIVPGSRPPFVKQTYQSNPGAWWYETTVLVGARFVIREHALCVSDPLHLSEVLRQRDAKLAE